MDIVAGDDGDVAEEVDMGGVSHQCRNPHMQVSSCLRRQNQYDH